MSELAIEPKVKAKRSKRNNSKLVYKLKSNGYSTYANGENPAVIEDLIKSFVLKNESLELSIKSVNIVNKHVNTFILNHEKYQNPILYELTIHKPSELYVDRYYLTVLIFLDNNYEFMYFLTDYEVSYNHLEKPLSPAEYSIREYRYKYLLETYNRKVRKLAKLQIGRFI